MEASLLRYPNFVRKVSVVLAQNPTDENKIKKDVRLVSNNNSWLFTPNLGFKVKRIVVNRILISTADTDPIVYTIWCDAIINRDTELVSCVCNDTNFNYVNAALDVNDSTNSFRFSANLPDDGIAILEIAFFG